MKRSIFLTAALVVLAVVPITAQAADAYVEAQKAALIKAGEVKVQEAIAEAAKWNAVASSTSKMDANGAALFANSALWADALTKVAKSHEAAPQIQRERDWVDKLNAVSFAVQSLGNVATNVLNITERGKTDRFIAASNVKLEEVKQRGESDRATAPRAPSQQTIINAQGDVANAGSTVDKGDRSDRRNCVATAGNGGPAAAGGSATTGTGATPTATAGDGAPGGTGGTASTTCN